jgi:hypothetical protein
MAYDSGASTHHAGVVRSQIRIRTRRVDQVEFTIGLVVGAVPRAVRLTVEVVKPRLDLGQVPYQAQQRHAGRRARTHY